MNGMSIIFNDKKINKSNSLKYLIEYNDNDNDIIRPLCMIIPQMIGDVKCFDSNKTTIFKALIKNC